MAPEDERPDADESDAVAEADDGMAPLVTNTGADDVDDDAADADAPTG
jgi:hypothetical protein